MDVSGTFGCDCKKESAGMTLIVKMWVVFLFFLRRTGGEIEAFMLVSDC